MKEYLTSNAEYFIEICKKIALTGYNLEPRSIKSKKFGCIFIATEHKAENWQNVRQQVSLMFFYRETELIPDSLLRQQLEEMKKQNYVNALFVRVQASHDQASSLLKIAPSSLWEKIN